MRLRWFPRSRGVGYVAIHWRYSRSFVCLSVTKTNITPVLLFELLWVRSNFSSLVLSYWRGRLCAYCQRSVLRSAFVPIVAISLFRTFTSGTPGSLITVVVGEIRTTVLPGAHVSHRPRRSCLDLLDTFLANFTSGEVSDRGIGLRVLREVWRGTPLCSFHHCISGPQPLRLGLRLLQWGCCRFRQSLIHYRQDNLQSEPYQRLISYLEFCHRKDLMILGLFLYYWVV